MLREKFWSYKRSKLQSENNDEEEHHNEDSEDEEVSQPETISNDILSQEARRYPKYRKSNDFICPNLLLRRGR